MARTKQPKPKVARRAKVKFVPPPPGFPAPPSPGPRNAELEAAIRAEPTTETVAVYADWLQQHANPLGELMIARQVAEPPPPSRRRDAKPRSPHVPRMITPEELALIERGVACGLPGDNFAQYGWRAGIWHWLRLDNGVEPSLELPAIEPLYAIADGLFASPLACALAELRFGVITWDLDPVAIPELIARAGKHAWAAGLARLWIGATENVDLAHYACGSVGPAASASFPNLAALTIHSAEKDFNGPNTFGLDGLALPRLATLVIETCSMRGARLAELWRAQLPALENLELWFGAADRNADATIADLAPLLEGRVFASAIRLGLRNTELADAIATRIETIAPRLVELDLSMGTLTDAGAAALVERRAAFRALRTLNVDDNFVSTQGGVAALRAAFDGVEVISHAQKVEETYGNNVYRYVTMAE